MSHELLYTSAPRGLQPGSRGFCTVAMTQGLPSPVLEKLEQLSGYRALFPPHDAKAALNPVSYAHLRLAVGGRTLRVLSRVCAAGLDYTERTNTFAHHVLLGTGELPPAGPAWLASQPGFLEPAWDGAVRVLTAGRTPPSGNLGPAPCLAWEETTGDAGWAGVLVEAFLTDPQRPSYLMFDPGVDPLPLLVEAIALLPVERRWEVTFSTYFTGLPQGVECAWRCVVRGTPEAKSRVPGALVLSLSQAAGAAPSSAAAEAARVGQSVMIAGPGSVDEPGEPIPVREPLHGQSGRPQQGQRPAELPRQTVGLVSGPASPSLAPPVLGTTQPVLPTPLHKELRRRIWRGGFLVGLLAGVLGLSGILGGMWYAGVLPSHDETALSLLRLENERLKEASEAIKKEKEKPMTEVRKLAPALKEESKGDTTTKSEGKTKEVAVIPMPMPPDNPPKKEKEPKPEQDPPKPTQQKPIIVPHGISLPTIEQSGLDDRPLSLAKAGLSLKSDSVCQLKLRGLPWKVQDNGLELQEAREGDWLVVLLKSAPDQNDKPLTLCRFRLEGENLKFRWEADDQKTKDNVQYYHQHVRNLALEITEGGRSQLVALRERRVSVMPDSPKTQGNYPLDWEKMDPLQGRPKHALLLGDVEVSIMAKKRETSKSFGGSKSLELEWIPKERILFPPWKDLASGALEVRKEHHKCQVKLDLHWEVKSLRLEYRHSHIVVGWAPKLVHKVIEQKCDPPENAKEKPSGKEKEAKYKQLVDSFLSKLRDKPPSVHPVLESMVIYASLSDKTGDLLIEVLRLERKSKTERTSAN